MYDVDDCYLRHSTTKHPAVVFSEAVSSTYVQQTTCRKHSVHVWCFLSVSELRCVCLKWSHTPSDKTPMEVTGELCGKRNLEDVENYSVLVLKWFVMK
jgi:hypothetical protein